MAKNNTIYIRINNCNVSSIKRLDLVQMSLNFKQDLCLTLAKLGASELRKVDQSSCAFSLLLVKVSRDSIALHVAGNVSAVYVAADVKRQT